MLSRLAERLASNIGEGDLVSVDTLAWKDPPERPAPRPDAFALLDRVTAAARAANETLPTAIGRGEVSRILRIDTMPAQRANALRDRGARHAAHALRNARGDGEHGIAGVRTRAGRRVRGAMRPLICARPVARISFPI